MPGSFQLAQENRSLVADSKRSGFATKWSGPKQTGASTSPLQRLIRLADFLRVHHGDRRHVDNVVHFRPALQHVHRLTQPGKQRPDQLASSNAL